MPVRRYRMAFDLPHQGEAASCRNGLSCFRVYRSLRMLRPGSPSTVCIRGVAPWHGLGTGGYPGSRAPPRNTAPAASPRPLRPRVRLPSCSARAKKGSILHRPAMVRPARHKSFVLARYHLGTRSTCRDGGGRGSAGPTS